MKVTVRQYLQALIPARAYDDVARAMRGILTGRKTSDVGCSVCGAKRDRLTLSRTPLELDDDLGLCTLATVTCSCCGAKTTTELRSIGSVRLDPDAKLRPEFLSVLTPDEKRALGILCDGDGGGEHDF